MRNNLLVTIRSSHIVKDGEESNPTRSIHISNLETRELVPNGVIITLPDTNLIISKDFIDYYYRLLNKDVVNLQQIPDENLVCFCKIMGELCEPCTNRKANAELNND